MIVEVRTYRVRPGLRDRFLELFTRRTGPLQRSLGMGIVGPLVSLHDPDVFIWLRTFPSLEARERMTRALYEGDEWLGELRAIALPMLDGYTETLTETAPACFDDLSHAVSPGASASQPHPDS